MTIEATSSAILIQKFTFIPYSVEIFHRIRHFLSISATFVAAAVLKHVLKSYGFFCCVHDSRKRVVGLITGLPGYVCVVTARPYECSIFFNNCYC